ncbi:iron-regulated membrane protein [Methylophaga frappieri]|uniref:Iron-regulated membrane protein n=1 Tax=Methylophaga frappieri (strain ATCC BAA-2434 / DSM 25690 / JAM7) TaxID=754477 RepID=I1YL82_METFJ|nr:PepSY-associated TM helix domain-containing protein [Methylophaga frappieri]AFJ03675.1 iron-regulated membrane protein [Methylophaga frappieri]
MFKNFGQAMTWVHTWFGLVIGFVLVVVFFFGSLSVFDREIDRWAIPESRFAPQPMPSFDDMLEPAYLKLLPHPDSLAETKRRVIGDIPDPASLPLTSMGAYTTHRDPVLQIFTTYDIPNKPVDANDEHVHVHGWATLDPRNGKLFADDQQKIGSRFFYPLHFNLTFTWMNLGYWIVGFAALIMLVGLITGVVIHHKVFREFFTFRPARKIQRSTLDLHNMTGVLGLPFHFFFAFTGLVIFAGIYFPVTHSQLEPLHELHELQEEQETGLPHDPAEVYTPMASVDAMVEEAQRRWAEKGMAGEVGFLSVNHYNDENGYVSIYRAGTDRVANVSDGIHFKASTGEVLHENPPSTVVGSIDSFLTGLHLQHFRHWLLRWLYVLGGLMGCVCIATGFIFFVEKRKQRHAKSGSQGSRVVDALAVTTVTGMLIATMAILIANRLLPETLPADWLGRDRLERYAFWGAWVLAMLHAFVRSAPVAEGKLNPAWREQSWAIAVMAVMAVLLNWITTGDHLLSTISAGYWPVAGVDLALLTSAAVAIFAAKKLQASMSAATSSVASNNMRREIRHVS